MVSTSPQLLFLYCSGITPEARSRAAQAQAMLQLRLAIQHGCNPSQLSLRPLPRIPAAIAPHTQLDDVQAQPVTAMFDAISCTSCSPHAKGLGCVGDQKVSKCLDITKAHSNGPSSLEHGPDSKVLLSQADVEVDLPTDSDIMNKSFGWLAPATNYSAGSLASTSLFSDLLELSAASSKGVIAAADGQGVSCSDVWGLTGNIWGNHPTALPNTYHLQHLMATPLTATASPGRAVALSGSSRFTGQRRHMF